jgi:hypothetical protein
MDVLFLQTSQQYILNVEDMLLVAWQLRLELSAGEVYLVACCFIFALAAWVYLALAEMSMLRRTC